MWNLLQCKNEASGHGLVRNMSMASSFGAHDSKCMYLGFQVGPSWHGFSHVFTEKRAEDKNPVFFSLLTIL